MENPTFEIIALMEELGGAFVKQLAVLWHVGDPINKAKLEAAFLIYFLDYDGKLTRSKQAAA